MKHFIYWTANVKSSELWYSQLLKQFMQLYIKKPETSQDFNRFWTRDLVILVRCSNQLSYDATDIGSWSFVAPKEPVRNDCSRHIWNISYIELQMWNQISYDPLSYEGNSFNWVYRSLKKLGLQRGLNPWRRYTSVRLTKWCMKPLMLGAGNKSYWYESVCLKWAICFTHNSGFA